MKKSIYSLVLMDEVVEAVDRMAYAMHTSRSNLINQILAERLSCITPEMRMQAIFSQMEARMAQHFRVQEQTSAHVLALQSPLSYKYKPTVQYSVELYRSPREGCDGRIRVQLRSQSRELLAVLDRFFRFWVLLEEKYLPVGASYQISPGRLERSIRNPCPEDGEHFGALITAYLNRLDAYMKAYFEGLAFSAETMAELEGSYCRELRQETEFI